MENVTKFKDAITDEVKMQMVPELYIDELKVMLNNIEVSIFRLSKDITNMGSDVSNLKQNM